jgi:pimeloyl-ACP methyl ester carboxylesterase
MGLIFGWGFDYQAKWRTGVLLRRYMPTADLSAEDIERWSWFERQLTSPDVVRTYMNRVLDTDVRAALPLIQAPTLVVHRTDNKTVPVDYGRDLGARIPGAKYVELPGDEHMRGLACRRPRSPGGSEKQWSSRSTRRE